MQCNAMFLFEKSEAESEEEEGHEFLSRWDDKIDGWMDGWMYDSCTIGMAACLFGRRSLPTSLYIHIQYMRTQYLLYDTMDITDQ